MGTEESTAAPRADPPEGPLELIMLSEGGMRQLPLPEEGALTIGRGEQADLQVDAPSLSRLHAQLNAGVPPTIEDLDSSNGTKLSGVKLKPKERAPLKQNMVISLGDIVLLVRRAPSSEHSQASAMQELHQLADLVAPSDLSVILLGETGVGKEVLARRIHERSARRDARLLTLNCAALPENIIESELFGHEKGAFTNALERKEGLLEAANGGTVLLDEVAELPLTAQAKLLRALESKEVQRLGATAPRKLDVRFIAATHRDLASWAREGKFREDLLHRLDGISIRIPPLRERLDELPRLCDEFSRHMCERSERPPVPVSPLTIERLRQHDWPGNIRELKKVIERAVVLCREDTIGPEHVRFGLMSASVPAPKPKPSDQALFDQVTAQKDQLERSAIQKALEDCNGNQTKAAKQLGISRRALINRIERYGLPRPRKS